MATEDLFHKEFLDLALGAYGQLPLQSAGAVYALYGGSGPRTAFNEGVMDNFLRALNMLRVQTNVMQVEVQQFPTDNNWAHLDDAFIGGLSETDKRNIWDTFFHFRRATTPATKRLYIHVHDPIATNGVSIIRELLAVRGADGMNNVKIGGPGCTDRADTIVAYFSDKKALQTVIDALQTDRFPSYWFAQGIPVGTLSMAYLKKPGIAGADEVPGENDIFGARSYGYFLATMIFEGYRQVYVPWLASNGGAAPAVKKEKYLLSVLAACKAAKVDAKTIYLTQKDFKKPDITDEQLVLELKAQAKLT